MDAFGFAVGTSHINDAEGRGEEQVVISSINGVGSIAKPLNGLQVPVVRFVGMNFSFRSEQMKWGELQVIHILHRPAITPVGGNKIISHRSARAGMSKQLAHVEAASGGL